MTRLTKVLIILAIVMTSVGCDQTAKMIAKTELDFNVSRSFFRGVVRFQYAENTGAFLSLGAHLPPIVRAAAVLLMAMVLFAGFGALLVRAHRLRTALMIAYSLILAGAFGNLVDRVFNDGKVIDFLVVGIGPVHTGIFNLADVLIMGGVALVFLTMFRHKEHGIWG
jgi:signal peptidase II